MLDNVGSIMKAIIYNYLYTSATFPIILTSDGERLIGLRFSNDKSTINATCDPSLPIFRQSSHWLDIYFRGEEPNFTPPILLKGTDFQMEVWDILQKISYGAIITYGDIAKTIAKNRGLTRMSSQAVGTAVGRNPIPIIIPCHRVVATSRIGGYSCGIEKKLELLRLEGIDTARFL